MERGTVSFQKHCDRQKANLRIRFKPSLFQHVGTHSSLAGKIQKLKVSTSCLFKLQMAFLPGQELVACGAGTSVTAAGGTVTAGFLCSACVWSTALSSCSSCYSEWQRCAPQVTASFSALLLGLAAHPGCQTGSGQGISKHLLKTLEMMTPGLEWLHSHSLLVPGMCH